jgi:hypothetical protein
VELPPNSMQDGSHAPWIPRFSLAFLPISRWRSCLLGHPEKISPTPTRSLVKKVSTRAPRSQAPAPQTPGGAGEAQATLNRRSPWMPSRPPAAIIFPLAPSMLARSLQGKIPHSPGIPCVGPSGCPRFF